MKLLYCVNCGDIIVPHQSKMKVCDCGETAGKYLEDKVTTVITKNCLVFGIDNNTWMTARQRAVHYRGYEKRLDFYFSGWFPNKPGEIIEVETVGEVEAFPIDHETENPGLSTYPWADETIWKTVGHGKREKGIFVKYLKDWIVVALCLITIMSLWVI